MRIIPRHLSRLAAVAALSLMCVAGAAVLPDDRADLFWSKYKGGGMDITGESVLVRKKFSEQFAVEANYFIDKVSGASVDVLSNASVIKDQRNQKSLSLDYIHNKTQYNLSYTNVCFEGCVRPSECAGVDGGQADKQRDQDEVLPLAGKLQLSRRPHVRQPPPEGRPRPSSAAVQAGEGGGRQDRGTGHGRNLSTAQSGTGTRATISRTAVSVSSRDGT